MLALFYGKQLWACWRLPGGPAVTPSPNPNNSSPGWAPMTPALWGPALAVCLWGLLTLTDSLLRQRPFKTTWVLILLHIYLIPWGYILVPQNCKYSLLSLWTCLSLPTTVSFPSQPLIFTLLQGTPVNLSSELYACIGKLMSFWTQAVIQPGNVTWSPLLADNWALSVWLMSENNTPLLSYSPFSEEETHSSFTSANSLQNSSPNKHKPSNL